MNLFNLLLTFCETRIFTHPRHPVTWKYSIQHFAPYSQLPCCALAWLTSVDLCPFSMCGVTSDAYVSIQTQPVKSPPLNSPVSQIYSFHKTLFVSHFQMQTHNLQEKHSAYSCLVTIHQYLERKFGILMSPSISITADGLYSLCI